MANFSLLSATPVRIALTATALVLGTGCVTAPEADGGSASEGVTTEDDENEFNGTGGNSNGGGDEDCTDPDWCDYGGDGNSGGTDSKGQGGWGGEGGFGGKNSGGWGGEGGFGGSAGEAGSGGTAGDNSGGTNSGGSGGSAGEGTGGTNSGGSGGSAGEGTGGTNSGGSGGSAGEGTGGTNSGGSGGTAGEGGSGGSAGEGGSGGTGGTPPTCDPILECVNGELTVANTTPTVAIVVDQSGSMNEDFGNVSRWNALGDILLNDASGLLRVLDNDVQFGLTLYQSNRGNTTGKVCPMLHETAFAFDSYDAMADLWTNSGGPNGDTPTAEALNAVIDEMVALQSEGPKAIVLATDGMPDTCDEPDSHGDPTTNQFSIDAAKRAYDAGIPLYVISVGPDVGEEHLAVVANAGAGLAIDGPDQAPYFSTNNYSDLKSSLEHVITGIRECTFKLDADVGASQVDEGIVTVDGVEIAQDGDNGWKLNSTDEIQLVGAACELIKSGTHRVEASFPCECEASDNGFLAD